MSFSSNTSSGYSLEIPDPPGELFNIISVQSSARPGCIIELDAFTDAKQVRFSVFQSINSAFVVLLQSDSIEESSCLSIQASIHVQLYF